MPSTLTGLILIVDDQPTNLEVICATLTAVGLEVAIATSGERALQQIARERPDLILLDIMMPGLDGFATCQRLKANPATRDIPVIFMTALADTESKVTALELGAVDYVIKPFHEQEVLARVRTHLQLSRLTQHLEQTVHQATAELQASRAAEADQQIAIAREREQAAQQHSAALARANEVMRRSIERLAGAESFDAILDVFLLEAVTITQADIGAVMERLSGTEFRIRSVALDGEISAFPETDPLAIAFRSATARDPAGVFRKIVQGQVHCQPVDDHYAIWFPEGAEFHRQRGDQVLWLFPFKIGPAVIGCLDIAFRDSRSFNQVMTETLQALTYQLSLALEMLRLSEAAQQTAIAREQEQAAQERAVELVKANAILQRTAAQMVNVQDLDRFLHALLLEVAQEVGAASNAIFLYDRQSDVCRMHYAVYDRQVIDLQTDPRFELWQTAVVPADNPNWLRIQSEGHIWCVLKPDPGGAALCDFAMVWHRKMQHRAVMCMRLQLGDEPLGYMGLFFREPVQPSPERIRLIQTLANQATLAIQLTRLSEETKQTTIAREQERAARERADELATANAALSRSIGQLTSVSKLGGFLDTILIEAVQASGAVSGAIFLHNIECDGLVNRSHVLHGELLDVEHDPRNAAFRDPIPVNRSLVWQTITANQEIFWIDFQHVDPLECPHLKAWHDAAGHRFVAAIPILQGFQAIGFMALAFAQTIFVQPTLAKLNLCQVLTQQAALAVRLTQLSDQAQMAAILREQEKAAQDRAAELVKANNALRRSISHLTTTDSLPLFLHAVLRETFQTSSDVHAAVVFGYQAAAHTIQLLAFVLADEAIDVATDPRAEVYRFPIPAETAGDWYIPNPERRIIWFDVNDPALERWAPSISWHKQQGHECLNVIPLFSEAQPLGFLGLAFTTRSAPTEAQIEQWWALAQYAGLAMRLANLADEAKQTAILDERNRMARDIHDSLAQSFIGIIMQMEALKLAPTSDPETAQTYLNRIGDLARLGLSEAQRSVQALRPITLETANLPEALHHLLQQMTDGTAIHADLQVEGSPDHLTTTLEENLLRIAQEAVTNAIRHGQAQTITLQLLFEPTAIDLQIRDDGQGFALDSAPVAGFGLIGMQERVHNLGGQFHLVSQPGQGTEITVTVPI